MSDLTKIILTAIISVVAKEFLEWLAGRVKGKQIGSKVKSFLFRIILNGLLKVFIDIPIIAFFGWLLYGVVISPSPLTREAVFEIALLTGLLLISTEDFFEDLGKFLNAGIEKNRKEREQEIQKSKTVTEVLTLITKAYANAYGESRDSLAVVEKDILPTDTSKETEKAKE